MRRRSIRLVSPAVDALRTIDGWGARTAAAGVTRPDAEMISISVADTGHGISPEDKDKLFLPHFSTKDRGTGLGLAIAARIIAEHGGTIHVEDNFPVGARFVLDLPVAELTPASVADHNGSDTAP